MLDVNGSWCNSPTDLCFILNRSGRDCQERHMDIDVDQWKHWFPQQLCSVIWGWFLSLGISMWAVQERSSSCSAQGLTNQPFINCKQMQHWNFALGVPTLPLPHCLPLSWRSYNPSVILVCRVGGFFGFFVSSLCVYVHKGERNVMVLWRYVWKRSQCKNWYLSKNSGPLTTV